MNKGLRNTIVLGGAALLGVAYLGKKVYSATRLQFYIAKVGFDLSSPFAPKILIDVMAQNPTGDSFTLSSLIGTLSFNGTYLGDIAFYTRTEVLPQAQTKIVVPVRVSLLGAATQLLQIIQGNSALAATVKMVGTANVNNIPAPYDLTFNII